jgi:flagellar biosynthesis anti-sigma factor FlgM
MKIDNHAYTIGSNSQAGSVQETGRNGRSAANRWVTSDASSDRAELPGFSGLVANASQAGSSDRAARVEQLRQLVASGQYQVDTKALSRSIVDAALRGE